MSAASSGAVKAPEFANSFTFSDNDIEGKIEKKTKKELWFFDWQPREQLVVSFSAIARSLLVMHQTTILHGCICAKTAKTVKPVTADLTKATSGGCGKEPADDGVQGHYR